jgi:spore coat polysaccharide biosynthesis protein SpsF
MRTIAIIQARMGSSRLPGKVLRLLLGQPMLSHIVERVGAARGVDLVVVATSDLAGDEPVRAYCHEAGIACFAGSERDVLDRFYQCALVHRADLIVRITGDCPLADPTLIDAIIRYRAEGVYDHAGIATGAGACKLDGGRYPDGLDAECFRFEALSRAWHEAIAPSDREHVTPFLWRQPALFKLGCLRSPVDYSHLRLTVDNEEDFHLISELCQALRSRNRIFTLPDILAYLAAHPELPEINGGLIGREDYARLWEP